MTGRVWSAVRVRSSARELTFGKGGRPRTDITRSQRGEIFLGSVALAESYETAMLALVGLDIAKRVFQLHSVRSRDRRDNPVQAQASGDAPVLCEPAARDRRDGGTREFSPLGATARPPRAPSEAARHEVREAFVNSGGAAPEARGSGSSQASGASTQARARVRLPHCDPVASGEAIRFVL